MNVPTSQKGVRLGALKNNGYDQEEAYFHKLNKELMQKAKEKKIELVKGFEPKPEANKPKPAK